jgi:hypothetical protein
VLNRFFIVFPFLFLFYITLPVHEINPQIEPYYEEVITKVHNRCSFLYYYHPSQFTIDFAQLQDINHPIIGVCQKNLNRYQIYVDEEFWETANDSAKYELIVHEMTHCLFLEGHSDDEGSYMYPSIRFLGRSTVTQQFDAYLDRACNIHMNSI